MSGILAQNKKFDTNLKQIPERVKKSSTIYNSISDAYLDEQFSFDNGDPFDFKRLLSMVGISLAVISFFAPKNTTFKHCTSNDTWPRISLPSTNEIEQRLLNQS